MSVVVPARNAAATLERALDALAPQLHAADAELVCVDDASTDGTGAIAVAWAGRNPDVRCTVVRAERRRWINGARNAGVAFARGSFVAFCDADDAVDPGWLRALADRRAPGVMVTGYLRDLKSGITIPPGGFYDVGLPMVFGGCFGLERTLLDAVGGFDERMRRGGTEAEFAVAAQLDHGATVVWVDDAVVNYSTHASRWRRLARQRGHAYVARRVATRRDGTTTTFTVARLARRAVGHLLAVMTGRRGPRRSRWEQALAELVAVFWLVRFTVHLPAPRRADPGPPGRCAVLVAPRDA